MQSPSWPTNDNGYRMTFIDLSTTLSSQINSKVILHGFSFYRVILSGFYEILWHNGPVIRGCKKRRIVCMLSIFYSSVIITVRTFFIVFIVRMLMIFHQVKRTIKDVLSQPRGDIDRLSWYIFCSSVFYWFLCNKTCCTLTLWCQTGRLCMPVPKHSKCLYFFFFFKAHSLLNVK